jgi:tetratricopeptide (TPR) repeat protein
MALSYFGDQVTQQQTAAVLKPDPEDRNVSPNEMARYVEEQTPHHALFRANGNQETVKRLLANNIPVIVEIGIEPPGEFRWLGWYGHYLLLVAYDEEKQQFWAYDSWFGTSEEPLQNAHPDGRVLTYEGLEQYWAHFNRNYIALYDEEQAPLISELIGEEIDDGVMWADALARSQADLESDPSNAFYWFNLGTNFTATLQYENAAAAFDQARAIGLPWRMLWYQFGPYEAYYNVGRYEDVVLLADTTLDDRPYFEESYYYKGLALDAMGDHDAARESLERATRFNPNFEPAQRALAEAG